MDALATNNKPSRVTSGSRRVGAPANFLILTITMDNPYYDIDEFHMPDEYAVDDEEEYPPVQPRGYERLMVPHQSLDNDSLDMDLEDDYMRKRIAKLAHCSRTFLALSSPTPYRAPTQSIPQIKQNKARSGFGMAGKPWYTPNPNQIPEFHDHMELQRPRIGFFGERNSVHDATQHLTPLNSTPCPLNRQGIQLRPVSDLRSMTHLISGAYTHQYCS